MADFTDLAVPSYDENAGLDSGLVMPIGRRLGLDTGSNEQTHAQN
jgi:hypothetical protein